MSICWFRFALCAPAGLASRALAGSVLGFAPKLAQHHEHQLVPFWDLRPNRASIMSISWLHCRPFRPTSPASRASAGCVLGFAPQQAQHQEHQLVPFWLCAPTGPASGASAGSTFGLFAYLAQHHEHQLVPFRALRPNRPSIMSISWLCCGALRPNRPGIRFALLCPNRPSIMSISWFCLGFFVP